MTYPIRIAVIDDDPAVLDAARLCSNCWVMPLGQRITGLELAEELRRRGIAIPTMLVSGYDLSDRDKGEEAEDRKGPRKPRSEADSDRFVGTGGEPARARPPSTL